MSRARTRTVPPRDSVTERSFEYLVDEEGEGARLDRFLAESIEELSRSAAARLIDEGDVSVNGEVVEKTSHRVVRGDRVRVVIPPPTPSGVVAEKIAVEILYEDDEVAVVDKPAGLVVHPSAGHESGTLVNALLYHLGSLSGIGGEERPGIVHRLDRGTSGLMVVAKTDSAHRFLQREWHTDSVVKRYVAIVYGSPKSSSFVIDAPIGRHPVDRKRMAIRDGGRAARTEVEVSERFGETSVLACRLLTGRTHQIRVHLEHAGHPIVGDPVYGGPRWRGIANAQIRKVIASIERPALHAAFLEFPHPETAEAMRFESALPEDMASLLAGVREP